MKCRATAWLNPCKEQSSISSDDPLWIFLLQSRRNRQVTTASVPYTLTFLHVKFIYIAACTRSKCATQKKMSITWSFVQCTRIPHTEARACARAGRVLAHSWIDCMIAQSRKHRMTSSQSRDTPLLETATEHHGHYRCTTTPRKHSCSLTTTTQHFTFTYNNALLMARTSQVSVFREP